MPTSKIVQVVAIAALAAFASAGGATPIGRPRASDLGLKVGILPAGPLDAITDVAGVKVGQTTIIRGDSIRTGVTAIHTTDKAPTRKLEVLTNDAMSPLFLAVIEATEEAIDNSLLKATTMTANGHTVEALPIDRTVDLLRAHKVIR